MMGGGSPPPPQIIYPPAAPPPAPTTQVPTQALASQSALNEVSGKQQRLNMELGAQLDRTNAEFFTGQDIRRGQAASAEQRLTIDKAGEDTRATARVAGQERRAEVGETGLQYRKGLETAAAASLDEIVLASSSATKSRSSGRATRLINPYSRAVSALINWPVVNISNAFFRGILRDNATIGVEQKRPILTPLTPNRAPSSATAKSQLETS